jgi:hypothetical protein
MDKEQYLSAKKYIEVQQFLEPEECSPGQLTIGGEQRLWREYKQAARVCQDLIAHHYKPPFYSGFDVNVLIPKNSVGQRMLRFIGLLWEELEGRSQSEMPAYEYRVFCPEIDLIRRAVSAALIGDGGEVSGIGYISPLSFEPWEFNLLAGNKLVEARDELNALADQLRSALLTKELRNAVKSYRRNATERYKHLMHVAYAGWRRNARNLLIRLDWGYRATYPSVPVEFKSQHDFLRGCEEINRQRKKMLEILRTMFGSDLTFFAWKIECSDYRGFHVHWLIAVDGAKHQDRINLPRQIAAAWDAEVGEGKGYTFNVNALRSMERTGLGVLGYDDPDLFDVLGLYCDYLTKVDYTVKLRMPKNMRSFGCSKLKEEKKKKPGPARSFEMQVKDIQAIRGPKGNRFFKARKIRV